MGVFIDMLLNLQCFCFALRDVHSDYPLSQEHIKEKVPGLHGSPGLSQYRPACLTVPARPLTHIHWIHLDDINNCFDPPELP